MKAFTRGFLKQAIHAGLSQQQGDEFLKLARMDGFNPPGIPQPMRERPQQTRPMGGIGGIKPIGTMNNAPIGARGIGARPMTSQPFKPTLGGVPGQGNFATGGPLAFSPTNNQAEHLANMRTHLKNMPHEDYMRMADATSSRRAVGGNVNFGTPEEQQMQPRLSDVIAGGPFDLQPVGNFGVNPVRAGGTAAQQPQAAPQRPAAAPVTQETMRNRNAEARALVPHPNYGNRSDPGYSTLDAARARGRLFSEDRRRMNEMEARLLREQETRERYPDADEMLQGERDIVSRARTQESSIPAESNIPPEYADMPESNAPPEYADVPESNAPPEYAGTEETYRNPEFAYPRN